MTNPPTLDLDAILKCYNEHLVATILTIRHANRLVYTNYGSALLAMLVKISRDALKCILKTASTRTS
jgi:hypothetical protein